MMGMKADHLKERLTNINQEEWEGDRVEGLGDHWQLLVALLQMIWNTGSIPTQMTWMIIVLLQKAEAVIVVLASLTPCVRSLKKLW
jgi:hypothetical protein